MFANALPYDFQPLTFNSEQLMLSESAREKIQALKTKYPHARSAVMPALYIAQAEYGWLPQNAIDEVAAELDLTATEVGSVASFYTMYHLQAVGRHVIDFCTDLPCALVGADAAYERLCQRLGLEQGQETTDDNAITLRHAPCLGGCDQAPVLLLDNNAQYEAMTDEKLDALIAQLRAAAHPS
ncbi:NADH-quinone oxidoreductase subunit NuoE [Anaerolineae bacterium CFX7]|nr:NADH-quinone oxidoreductase subunit NuoE [Anaerolineae bacterium CFX7]